MMLVSLISYVDRNTLALLAPSILAETGLTAEQYGYVISAFSIAYMFGNPVWGIVLDRYGLRRGMLAAVAFWTAASAAHAFAATAVAFGAARALLGFGEGATFPGGLRTAVQTLPADKRARGTALAYSGGSLGAVITPLIVTPVALRFGWRGAFWFTGIIGFLWLVLWLTVSRGMSRQEAPRTTYRTARVSIRDRRLWAFVAAYALGASPLAFVIYGAAIYLNRVRGLTQAELGMLLWIPPLGWEIGYFFWGWLADRTGRGIATSRRLLGVATVLSLVLAAAPFAPGTALVMFALFLSMFTAAAFIILSISYATDVFSSDSAGLIAGLGAGSWSALVAVTMPIFGRLFDGGQFLGAFALAAVIPIAGYALWCVLGAGGEVVEIQRSTAAAVQSHDART